MAELMHLGKQESKSLSLDLRSCCVSSVRLFGLHYGMKFGVWLRFKVIPFELVLLHFFFVSIGRFGIILIHHPGFL